MIDTLVTAGANDVPATENSSSPVKPRVAWLVMLPVGLPAPTA